MGKKGDKLINSSTQAAEDLQRRLSTLGEITTKKMFGGYGIFESGKMFALVDSAGGVYLKADDTNRGRFEEVGSKIRGIDINNESSIFRKSGLRGDIRPGHIEEK